MRKILAVIYLLYASLIFLILMLAVGPFILLCTSVLNEKQGRKVSFFFLKIWAWGFSSFSLFWFQRRNHEHIDTSKSYIYVGNHNSYLDAVAIVISIPQPFSPLGKVEMAKVPVFGWIYKRLVVMIDRSSKESREASVNELKKDLEGGQSVLIFPEGTMNKTDIPLTHFYDGAFRLAIETKTNIIPFVILNSKKYLPRLNPLMARPGITKTVFGEPIKVNGYDLDKVSELKDKVYQEMLLLIDTFG